MAAGYLLMMQPSPDEALARNNTPTMDSFLQNSRDCQPLDVLFLVDATASMISEIPETRKTIFAATNVLSRDYADTRYALSFVGDFSSNGGMYDLPYVRQVDFTTDATKIGHGMNQVPSFFGGYEEEAYAYALRKSSQEKWRKDAAKVVILFADNKDHNDSDLEKSVKDVPYQLIVLTTDNFAGYWSKFADYQRSMHKPELTELLESIAEQHCQSDDFCQRY